MVHMEPLPTMEFEPFLAKNRLFWQMVTYRSDKLIVRMNELDTPLVNASLHCSEGMFPFKLDF